MKKLLRRIRGAIGLGLTWGILWAAIGAALGLATRIAVPGSIDPGENELVIGAMIGFVGLVSGLGFGTLLSFAESRKSIRELSLGRAALWGILGSAALPLLTGMQDVLVFVTCPLGALFASASVAIARKAELRDSDQAILPPSDPFREGMATREREHLFVKPS